MRDNQDTTQDKQHRDARRAEFDAKRDMLNVIEQEQYDSELISIEDILVSCLALRSGAPAMNNAQEMANN